MSIQDIFGQSALLIWQNFIKVEQLSELQSQQFEQYIILLDEWNKKTNLTRIVEFPDMVAYHLQDSIAIRKFVNINERIGIADVGSGAGFPGIPLKILFPDVPMVLVEVNLKKVAFLEAVIEKLNLPHCHISTLDWRTFLRVAPYEIDLFCARASLQPEELLRIYKPSSAYKQALLVYWASKQWEPNQADSKYLIKKESYTVDFKSRVFAFFSDTKV